MCQSLTTHPMPFQVHSPNHHGSHTPQFSYKYPKQHAHHSPTFPPIYHCPHSFLYLTRPFITILTHSPMNTRAKNKSAHPAAPIMTPAQLSAAGISQPKRPRKKQTKDQQIAALKEDLRATQELLQTVPTPLITGQATHNFSSEPSCQRTKQRRDST